MQKEVNDQIPMTKSQYCIINIIRQRRTLLVIGYWSLVILFFLSAFSLAMDLNESVNTAMSYSPQIIAAQKNVDSLRAKLYQAGGALVPQIGLSAGMGNSYSQPMTVLVPSMGAFSVTPDETARVANYSLTLNQPVFTGGRLLMAFSIAQASFGIANEDLKKTKDDVTFNVTQAYYNVLKAQKMVELNSQETSNTEKYLRRVQVFYDSGLATKADLLRVEAEIANQKQQAIVLNNALTVAKYSFNSLLGRKLLEEVSLIEPGTVLNTTDAMPTDKLISMAYSTRPDWLGFLLTKQIVDTGVGVAWGALFPSLSLSGSVGRNFTYYPSRGPFDLGNWRAMFVGSWNIFDGLANLNKVAEAKASADQIKAQEQQVKDNLELEITSAASDLKSSYQQINASEITARLAKQSLEYAQVSYANGIGTNIAVLDAQTLLYQSETSLWSSRYDYQVAKAKINKSIGSQVYKL